MRTDRTATAMAVLALLACSTPPAPECTLPATVAPLPAELREASGATVTTDGTLWLIADSGPAVAYAVDGHDRIVGRLRLDGLRNDDWEDLASGPCGDGGECLFIAEIGDNLHRAPERSVLRVRLPDGGASHADADRLRFRYPDGPRDAEALALLPDGSLLVISKGRNGPIGVYRYPAPPRPDTLVTLHHVQDLSEGIAQLPQQVTGAAVTPDGRTAIVRSYSALQAYTLDDGRLAVRGRSIALAALGEPQGEGVAVGPGGSVILVGEDAGHGTIARLQCTGLAP